MANAVQEMKSSNLDKIVLARELRVTFKNRIVSERVLQNLMEEQPTSYILALKPVEIALLEHARTISKKKEMKYFLLV